MRLDPKAHIGKQRRFAIQEHEWQRERSQEEEQDVVEEKAKEVTHAKDDEVLADVRDLLDHLPDHGLLNPVLEHSHFSIFGLRVLLAR